MPRDDNIPTETQQGKRILSGQALQTEDPHCKTFLRTQAGTFFPSQLSRPATCLQAMWFGEKETFKDLYNLC